VFKIRYVLFGASKKAENVDSADKQTMQRAHQRMHFTVNILKIT